MNADPSPATMHNEHVSADQTDDDLCEEEPPDDPPEAKWRFVYMVFVVRLDSGFHLTDRRGIM